MTTTHGQAHFQLFAIDTPVLVRWRLLSGNHRELGRSVAGFADSESCLLGVKTFVASLEELVPQVRRREGNGWGWLLSNADGPVAACGRPYDRQVRCEQALLNFLDLAPVARADDMTVITAARRWARSSLGRQPMQLNSGVDRPRRISRPAT